MWMQLFYSWGVKLKNNKPWINVNLNQRLTAGSKVIDDSIDITPYLVSERLIKLPKNIPGVNNFEQYKLFRRRIIGSWIQHLRKLEGVTQKQVAAELGMEQSTLSKIESGKRNFSAVTLLLICKFLKVDFDSTLGIL
jgi:DNA-binding XRE family transcriptional regulator